METSQVIYLVWVLGIIVAILLWRLFFVHDSKASSDEITSVICSAVAWPAIVFIGAIIGGIAIGLYVLYWIIGRILCVKIKDS